MFDSRLMLDAKQEPKTTSARTQNRMLATNAPRKPKKPTANAFVTFTGTGPDCIATPGETGEVGDGVAAEAGGGPT